MPSDLSAVCNTVGMETELILLSKVHGFHPRLLQAFSRNSHPRPRVLYFQLSIATLKEIEEDRR